MRIIFRSMLAAALIVPGAIAELPAEKKNELESRLRRSTTPEIPATVLGIIRAAEAAQRVETIEASMEVVALRRPHAVPLVVSTIAKAEPELSGAAVSAAIQVAPKQATLIERAAVTAAPEQADAISLAIRGNVENKGQRTGSEENGNGKTVEFTKGGQWPDFDAPLPNGKVRPKPPRRPVDPPRPVHYNKPPKPDRPGHPEHPLPERPGNPNPDGKVVRPAPPGGHPVWDR